jgi:hypothetical protein
MRFPSSIRTPESRPRKGSTAQKEVVGKLEKILDATQRKRLLERRAGDPMGFAGMATPGQILPLPTQVVLKLSAEQKSAVATLQKACRPDRSFLIWISESAETASPYLGTVARIRLDPRREPR